MDGNRKLIKNVIHWEIDRETNILCFINKDWKTQAVFNLWDYFELEGEYDN